MVLKFVLPIALLISGVMVAAGECGESPRRVAYEFRFAAQVTNLPESAAQVDLWMPVPSDSQGQKVERVEIIRPSGGQVQTEPEYQNRIFHRRFSGPFTKSQSPPAAELVFDIVRTEVVIPEAKALNVRGHAGKPISLDVYLQPNRLIPIGGKVSQIAEGLHLPKHDPLRVGRRLYDYLIDTMVYNWKAPGAGRGDVLWACDSKTGDCTDYHSMFIALCRSQGIPADHEFGFPIRTQEKAGTIAHNHCWARFWVEGLGWIPVDISEADKHPELREYNFGSLTPKLLKLTHGRDILLAPPQSGERLNYFVYPYAEVDGKPSKNVKWSMAFKVRHED